MRETGFGCRSASRVGGGEILLKAVEAVEIRQEIESETLTQIE